MSSKSKYICLSNNKVIYKRGVLSDGMVDKENANIYIVSVYAWFK